MVTGGLGTSSNGGWTSRPCRNDRAGDTSLDLNVTKKVFLAAPQVQRKWLQSNNRENARKQVADGFESWRSRHWLYLRVFSLACGPIQNTCQRNLTRTENTEIYGRSSLCSC